MAYFEYRVTQPRPQGVNVPKVVLRPVTYTVTVWPRGIKFGDHNTRGGSVLPGGGGSATKVVPWIFFIAGGQVRRAEGEGEVLGEGAATPPHQLGVWRAV